MRLPCHPTFFTGRIYPDIIPVRIIGKLSVVRGKQTDTVPISGTAAKVPLEQPMERAQESLAYAWAIH